MQNQASWFVITMSRSSDTDTARRSAVLGPSMPANASSRKHNRGAVGDDE